LILGGLSYQLHFPPASRALLGPRHPLPAPSETPPTFPPFFIPSLSPLLFFFFPLGQSFTILGLTRDFFSWTSFLFSCPFPCFLLSAAFLYGAMTGFIENLSFTPDRVPDLPILTHLIPPFFSNFLVPFFGFKGSDFPCGEPLLIWRRGFLPFSAVPPPPPPFSRPPLQGSQFGVARS